MIIKIVLLCLVSAIMIQLFRSIFPQLVPIIAICTGFIVFSMLHKHLNTAFSFIDGIINNASGFGESIKISVKTIGISVVCEFASQLCSDMGEGYLASKIDFAGKVIIFCLILPKLIDILNIIAEMIRIV